MGGGSSKVDNYVLHIADEGTDQIAKMSSKSKGSGKHQLTKEKSGLERGKSSSKLENGQPALMRAQSRRGSASPLPTESDPPPSLANGRKKSSAQLQVQPSSKALMRSNSVAKSCTQSSGKCPWLLKNANLNGTQVSDFECGRVIGTLTDFVYVFHSDHYSIVHFIFNAFLLTFIFR